MRDGRRNRLGLANGTEPELFSDLVSTTTPVVDNAATADQDYLNRILTDVDVAGEPNILSLDPDANVRTTDQRYLQDAYNYYLGGGFDASQPDFPIQADDFTGGEMIDTGDAAQIPGAVDTLVNVNTPFEQNLLDQGVGVQGAPGDPVVAPGEIPVTQAEMDEYNFYGPSREYGKEMDIGYGEGQVDPQLAAAVGGKDTTRVTPTITGPTGDIYAPGDYSDVAGTLADPEEKMDYTKKSPTWWGEQRDKFLSTGQDVGNFFTNLKNQGIDVARMTMGAILSAIQPGLGLLSHLIPETTPIDKFNRQYQVGGDFYEDIVKDDPKFEGRLEGYADDLIAGTGEGKDPFGKNTVSLAGDYPAMATKTFNELTEKAKTKELSQFDKDRLDYYGHVSGLTGKTNIPGTPLMVDQPISLDDIVEEQKAKNELAKITGDWGDLETATGILDEIDTPTDIVDAQAVKENIKKAEAKALANQEAEARAQREMQEQIAAAEAMEVARLADIDRVNREREARRAAAPITAPVPAHIIGGGGGGQGGGGQPGSAPTGTAGRNPWGRAKGGLIRKQYGKGGIVDLL